jgi:hypothetical protein
MLWASRYSGYAIQFNKAVQFAAGGYTTQEVVDSALADCAASDAGSVVVMVGVDDEGQGVSQADSFANIDTIVSTLVGAGKLVFFCDDAPASGEDSAGLAQHTAIRDYIRGLEGTDGVVVVPTWDAAAASPDSTTIGDGYEGENDSPPPTANPHFGPGASSRVGQAVATAMAPHLPAFDLFGRADVLSGGDFTGSSGTKTGGVTGSVPAGWTVALESGSGTVACSIEAADGLNWLVVTLTGGDTPIIGVYSDDLSTGWTAGTDYIDMAAKCRIDAGCANIFLAQLQARRDGAATIPLTGVTQKAYDGAVINSTTDLLPAESMDMTLWLPAVKYPAGATALIQRFEIRGHADATSAGVFRFALPQLRKYTGELTD